MKLRHVRVTEFQSVWDSDEFEVGDLTCLVGKNEAGKTALLQALYRLNPIHDADDLFDVTDDYPRSEVEDYRQSVESGDHEPSIVIQATFTLDSEELEPISQVFGEGALSTNELTLEKGYSNELCYQLDTDCQKALRHLGENAGQLTAGKMLTSGISSLEDVIEALKNDESTPESNELLDILSEIHESGFDTYVYERFLEPWIPKFLYFDEYYQMRGYENMEALKERIANSQLRPSDHPILGLIDLAGLDLDALMNLQRTQELVNRLEGAGNHLGRRVLQYWSQNRHLQMRFDVRPAKAGDPEGMRTGTNIWAGVYDSRHMVTTNLGTRSRGFVWFFSFLAWFSKVRREYPSLILLLDEPGLLLHGKAQEDLLRYFEHELKPTHQLIYTTHSPFMVDAQNFGRVRIVQDKGLDTLEALPREQEGTKVLTDVLEATGDSLFPLQGALGYEIYQTLFIGPNSLIVEGISDLLYLQSMSGLLETRGRQSLSERWTITPVGGASKVATFVSLIGAQRGMKIATLIDVHKEDQQTIESLYKRKLLKKSNVLTFADFTGTPEADIEDMFETKFYLSLINEEYASALTERIKPDRLNAKTPRILARLDAYFNKNPLKDNVHFNHYRPARYLSERIGQLEEHISEETLDRFDKACKQLNTLL